MDDIDSCLIACVAVLLGLLVLLGAVGLFFAWGWGLGPFNRY